MLTFLRSRLLWTFLAVTFFALAIRLPHLHRRMTHVDDIGWVHISSSTAPGLAAAADVSRGWTYAPGQFVLASHLIRNSSSWDNFLFRLRLPSAICGSVGVGLLAYLLLRIQGEPYRFTSMAIVVPVVLGLTSLRAIIEAQQGYNYASTGILVGVVLLSLLRFPRIGRNPIAWHARTLLTVSLAALAVLGSYQMVFVLACVLAFLATDALRDLPTLVQTPLRLPVHALSATLIVGFAASIIYPIYSTWMVIHLARTGSTPRWAHRDLPPSADAKPRGIVLREQAVHSVKTLNRLMAYGLTPVWPDAVGHHVLTRFAGPLLLLLAGFGVGSLFRRGATRDQFMLGGTSLALLFGFLAGNLLRHFPLGLTRHSHILMIPCLILVSLGLSACARWLTTRWQRHYQAQTPPTGFRFAGLAMVCVLFACFAMTYRAFHDCTRNNVSLPLVFGLAARHGAAHVFGVNFTWDPVIWSVSCRQSPACPCSILNWDENHRLASRLQSIATGPSAPILLLSHREDPLATLGKLVEKHTELEAITLLAQRPRGSTELVGNLNGGNGCFVVLIRRKSA